MKINSLLKHSKLQPCASVTTTTQGSTSMLSNVLKKKKLKCHDCGNVVADVYTYEMLYDDEIFCPTCGKLRKLKE